MPKGSHSTASRLASATNHSGSSAPPGTKATVDADVGFLVRREIDDGVPDERRLSEHSDFRELGRDSVVRAHNSRVERRRGSRSSGARAQALLSGLGDAMTATPR